MNQKLRQFQLDLDAVCGAAPKQPRRLTGIEKAALSVDPLDLIDEEYKDVFQVRRPYLNSRSSHD